MNAFLCGYYGMKNSGDDALLYSTAWAAKHLLNVRSVSVSSPCPMSLPGFGIQPPGLTEAQTYRGQRRLQHYVAAYRSERVIFGGGSVFHTAQDISIKNHLMSLSKGHSHYACGVGLGPFKTVSAEKACRKFLNKCDFVGVRDKESLDVALSLAPDAHVQLTFDLAPLLLVQKERSLKQTARSGIAVSLCPVFDCADDDQEQRMLLELAEALRQTQQETGEVIYLIDFNGHDSLGDRQIHQKLRSLLGEECTVRHIPYDPDPISVLQRMYRFKLLVGMRLHAAVFAYLTGTPAFSLEYHSKCGGWSEQIGQRPEYRFSTATLDADQLKNQAISGLQRSFLMPSLPVSRAIALSKTNWSNDYVNVNPSLLCGHPAL